MRDRYKIDLYIDCVGRVKFFCDSFNFSTLTDDKGTKTLTVIMK